MRFNFDSCDLLASRGTTDAVTQLTSQRNGSLTSQFPLVILTAHFGLFRPVRLCQAHFGPDCNSVLNGLVNDDSPLDFKYVQAFIDTSVFFSVFRLFI